MLKSTKNLSDNNDLVAQHSPIVQESLPFPIVHYPSFYGTFFTFSQNENGKEFFCNCTKHALKNYLEFYNPLFTMDFPPSVIEKYQNKKISSIDQFAFKDALCHRCNQVTPTRQYCDKMYGSSFKIFHGWYVNLNFYKLGLKRLSNIYISSYCPDEVIELIEERKKLAIQRWQLLGVSQEDAEKNNFNTSNSNVPRELPKGIYEIDKKNSKTKRQIEKYIENITRIEFGYRKVGEGWIAETQLYKIVKHLFPDKTILRHHRPGWLNHLELDIYIESLQIGIEYQGQQHYKPIKLWGGEKALKEQKGRDKLKKKLCVSNNIKLIEFKYTEPLTEDYIRSKIFEHINSNK